MLIFLICLVSYLILDFVLIGWDRTRRRLSYIVNMVRDLGCLPFPIRLVLLFPLLSILVLYGIKGYMLNSYANTHHQEMYEALVLEVNSGLLQYQTALIHTSL